MSLSLTALSDRGTASNLEVKCHLLGVIIDDNFIFHDGNMTHTSSVDLIPSWSLSRVVINVYKKMTKNVEVMLNGDNMS